MGATMAKTLEDFRTWAASALAVVLTAAVLTIPASANAAELKCYAAPEVQEMASQMQSDGIVPLFSRYQNAGTDAKPEWLKNTLWGNLDTGNGYGSVSFEDTGKVCVLKSYTELQIFNYEYFDARAFVDTKKYPSANDVGNGSDYNTIGINSSILASKKLSENPVYRAKAYNPTAAASGLPVKYLEVYVGNKATGEGTLLAADFKGKNIGTYTQVAGIPQRDGVAHGIMYAPYIRFTQGSDPVRASQ